MSNVNFDLTGNDALKSKFHAARLKGASLPINYATQANHMSMIQSNYTSEMDPSAAGSGHDSYSELKDVTLSDQRYWQRNKEGTVYMNCNLLSVEMIASRTSNMLFEDCNLMRFRLMPKGLHASGMKFHSCKFGRMRIPDMGNYPSSKMRDIDSETALFSNYDVTMFCSISPWDRKVTQLDRSAGEYILGALGYSNDANPELTKYTFPELFTDRITGKNYSAISVGKTMTEWMLRHTNQRVSVKVRRKSNGDAVKNELTLEEDTALKRGDTVFGVFGDNASLSQSYGIITALGNDDEENAGDIVWDTTSIGQVMVERKRLGKDGDPYKKKYKYIRLSKPVTDLAVTFTALLPVTITVGDDLPAIGYHNEPLNKKLMVHSTQALYRYPSNSFVPDVSEEDEEADEDVKNLREQIKNVFGKEEDTAENVTGEYIRLPYHHEATHTSIQKLREWATKQDPIYIQKMEFHKCTMSNMVFINVNFMNCSFRDCRMHLCWFINCTFDGTVFHNNTIIDCPGLHFRFAYISGTLQSLECKIPYNENVLDMTRATIVDAIRLNVPDFTVKLTHAIAADNNIVLKGAKAFEDAPVVQTKKQGTFQDTMFLPNESIVGEDFDECEFNNFRFNETQLTATDFLNCTLYRTDFKEGYMRHCMWKSCDITHSAFRLCDINDVIFRECDFYDVDLSLHTGVRFLRCKLKRTNFEQYKMEHDGIQRFELELSTLDSSLEEPKTKAVLSFDQARMVRSTMRFFPDFYFFMKRSSLRDSYIVFGSTQDEVDSNMEQSFFNNTSLGVVLYGSSADLTNTKIVGLVHLRPTLGTAATEKVLKCFVSEKTDVQGINLVNTTKFVTLKNAYSPVSSLSSKLFAFPLDLFRSIVYFHSTELVEDFAFKRLHLKKGELTRNCQFNREEVTAEDFKLKHDYMTFFRVTLENSISETNRIVDIFQEENGEPAEVLFIEDDDKTLFVKARVGSLSTGQAKIKAHQTGTPIRYASVTTDTSGNATAIYTETNLGASALPRDGGVIHVVHFFDVQEYKYTSVTPSKRKIEGLTLLSTYRATEDEPHGELYVGSVVKDNTVNIVELTNLIVEGGVYILPTNLSGVFDASIMNVISTVDMGYTQMNSKGEPDPARTHFHRMEGTEGETLEDYTLRIYEDEVHVGTSVTEWALTEQLVLEFEMKMKQYAMLEVWADQQYMYSTCYGHVEEVKSGVIVDNTSASSSTITINVTGADDSMEVSDIILIKEQVIRDHLRPSSFSASGVFQNASLKLNYILIYFDAVFANIADGNQQVYVLESSTGDSMECTIVTQNETFVIFKIDGHGIIPLNITSIQDQDIKILSTSRSLPNRTTVTRQKILKSEAYTEIRVESTNGFANNGFFYIGRDLFQYASKTGNSFTEVQRLTDDKEELPENSPLSLILFDDLPETLVYDVQRRIIDGEVEYTHMWETKATSASAESLLSVYADVEALPKCGFGELFAPTPLELEENFIHVRHTLPAFGEEQIEEHQTVTLEYGTDQSQSFFVDKSRIVRQQVLVEKGKSPVVNASVILYNDARDFSSSGGVMDLVYDDGTYRVSYTGIADDGENNELVGVSSVSTLPVVQDGSIVYAYPLYSNANVDGGSEKREVEIICNAKKKASNLRNNYSKISYDRVVGVGKITAITSSQITINVDRMERYDDAESSTLSFYRAFTNMNQFALLGTGSPYTRKSWLVQRCHVLEDPLPVVQRIGNMYTFTFKTLNNGEAFSPVPMEIDGESLCVLVPGYGSASKRKRSKKPIDSLLDIFDPPKLYMKNASEENELLEGAIFRDATPFFTLGSDKCPIESFSFPGGDILPSVVHFDVEKEVPDRTIILRSYHQDIVRGLQEGLVDLEMPGVITNKKSLSMWQSGDIVPDNMTTIGTRRNKNDSRLGSIPNNISSCAILSMYRRKNTVRVGAACDMMKKDTSQFSVVGNVFTRQHFQSCWMEHTIFAGSTFRDCVFHSLCNLTGADFSNCVFENCTIMIGSYTLGGMDFRGATFKNTTIDTSSGPYRLNNVRLENASFDERSKIEPEDAFVKLWGASRINSLPVELTQSINMAFFRMGEAANMRDTDLSGVNLVGTDFYLADFGSSFMEGAMVHPQDIGLTIMNQHTIVPKMISHASSMTFSTGRARNAQLIDNVQRNDLRGADMTEIPITRGARFNFSIIDAETQFPNYIIPELHIPGAINVDTESLFYKDITGLQMKNFHALKDDTVLARAQKVMENDDVAIFHRVSEGLEFDAESDGVRDAYTPVSRQSGIFMRALALSNASDTDKDHLLRQYRHIWKKLHPNAGINPSAVSCDADIVHSFERDSRINVTGFTGETDDNFMEKVRRSKLSEVKMKGKVGYADILGTSGKNIISEDIYSYEDWKSYKNLPVFHFLRPVKSRLLERDENGNFSNVIEYAERGEACPRGGDPAEDPNFNNGLFNRTLDLNPDPWSWQRSSLYYRDVFGEYKIECDRHWEHNHKTTPVWLANKKNKNLLPDVVWQWPLCDLGIGKIEYESLIGKGLPSWMTDDKPDVAEKKSFFTKLGETFEQFSLTDKEKREKFFENMTSQSSLLQNSNTVPLAKLDDEVLEDILERNFMDKTKYTRALKAMRGTFLDQALMVQSTEVFSENGGIIILSDFKTYLHYSGKNDTYLLGVSSYDPDLEIKKYDPIYASSLPKIDPVTSENKGGMYPGCLPHLKGLDYELTPDMIPPNFDRDRDLWLEAEIPAYYYTKEDIAQLDLLYAKNTFGKTYTAHPENYYYGRSLAYRNGKIVGTWGYWDSAKGDSRPNTGGYHTALFDKGTKTIFDTQIRWGMWNSDEWRTTFNDIKAEYFPPILSNTPHGQARYTRIRVRIPIGTARQNIRRIDKALMKSYYSNIGSLLSSKNVRTHYNVRITSFNKLKYRFQWMEPTFGYSVPVKAVNYSVGDLLYVVGYSDFVVRVTELRVHHYHLHGTKDGKMWKSNQRKKGTFGEIGKLQVLSAPENVKAGTYEIRPLRTATDGPFSYKVLGDSRKYYEVFIQPQNSNTQYPNFVYTNSALEAYGSVRTTTRLEKVLDQRQASDSQRKLAVRDTLAPYVPEIAPVQRESDSIIIRRLKRHYVVPDSIPIDKKLDLLSACTWDLVRKYARRKCETENLLTFYEDPKSGVGMSSLRVRGDIFPPQFFAQSPAVMAMTDISFCAIEATGKLKTCRTGEEIAAPDTEFRNLVASKNSISAVTEGNNNIQLGVKYMPRYNTRELKNRVSVSAEGAIIPKPSEQFDKEEFLVYKLYNKADKQQQKIFEFDLWIVESSARLRTVPVGTVKQLQGADADLFDEQKLLKADSPQKSFYHLQRTVNEAIRQLIIVEEAEEVYVPRTLVEEWTGMAIPGYGVFVLKEQGEWSQVNYGSKKASIRTLVSDTGMPTSVVASDDYFAAVETDTMVADGLGYARQYGPAIQWNDSHATVLYSNAQRKKAIHACKEGFLVVDPSAEGIGIPLHCKINNTDISVGNEEDPCLQLAAASDRFGAICRKASDSSLVVKTFGTTDAVPTFSGTPQRIFGTSTGFVLTTTDQVIAWGGFQSFGTFSNRSEGVFVSNHSFEETVIIHEKYIFMRRSDTKQGYINGEAIPDFVDAIVDMTHIHTVANVGEELDLFYVLTTHGVIKVIDLETKEVFDLSSLGNTFASLHASGSEVIAHRSDGEVQFLNGSELFPSSSLLSRPEGLGKRETFSVELKTFDENTATLQLLSTTLSKSIAKSSMLELVSSSNQKLKVKLAAGSNARSKTLVIERSSKQRIDGTVSDSENNAQMYSIVGEEPYDIQTESGATRNTRLVGVYGMLYLNSSNGEFTYEVTGPDDGYDAFSILKFSESLPAASSDNGEASIVHIAHLEWAETESEINTKIGTHFGKVQSASSSEVTISASQWPPSGALVSLEESEKNMTSIYLMDTKQKSNALWEAEHVVQLDNYSMLPSQPYGFMRFSRSDTSQQEVKHDGVLQYQNFRLLQTFTTIMAQKKLYDEATETQVITLDDEDAFDQLRSENANTYIPQQGTIRIGDTTYTYTSINKNQITIDERVVEPTGTPITYSTYIFNTLTSQEPQFHPVLKSLHVYNRVTLLEKTFHSAYTRTGKDEASQQITLEINAGGDLSNAAYVLEAVPCNVLSDPDSISVKAKYTVGFRGNIAERPDGSYKMTIAGEEFEPKIGTADIEMGVDGMMDYPAPVMENIRIQSSLAREASPDIKNIISKEHDTRPTSYLSEDEQYTKDNTVRSILVEDASFFDPTGGTITLLGKVKSVRVESSPLLLDPRVEIQFESEAAISDASANIEFQNFNLEDSEAEKREKADRPTFPSKILIHRFNPAQNAYEVTQQNRNRQHWAPIDEWEALTHYRVGNSMVKKDFYGVEYVPFVPITSTTTEFQRDEDDHLTETGGIELLAGGAYRKKPTATWKIVDSEQWEGVPQNTSLNRSKLSAWQEKELRENPIRIEWYEPITLQYTKIVGNRIYLTNPHTFKESLPSRMMVEAEKAKWKAAIVPSNAATNIRSVVANNAGTGAAFLRTNRISDVCMNCRKAKCPQIKVNGRFGSTINVYECMGHRKKEWDLSERDLTGIILNGTSLKRVKCNDTLLLRAQFTTCEATRCTFERAYMRHANLKRANFSKCDFTDTRLQYADLRGTTFLNCNFSEATLNHAIVDENTSFVDCNMNGANLRFISFAENTFRGSESRFIDADFRESLNPPEAAADAQTLPATPETYTVSTFDSDTNILSIDEKQSFTDSAARRGRVVAMKPGDDNVVYGTYQNRTVSSLLKVEWQHGDATKIDNTYICSTTDLRRCSLTNDAFIDLTLMDFPNALGPQQEDLSSIRDLSSIFTFFAKSRFTSFDIDGRYVHSEITNVDKSTNTLTSALHSVTVGDTLLLMNGETNVKATVMSIVDADRFTVDKADDETVTEMKID